MATINQGAISTNGDLPAVGSKLPAATATNVKREDVSLDSFGGWRILSLFPSIDTGVCAMSVRRFNELASDRSDVTVLNISADLPFAQARWCGAEGLDKVVMLSTFRSNLISVFGTQIVGGVMAGLSARAIVVVDPDGVVRHTELVSMLGSEPNYDAALAAVGS